MPHPKAINLIESGNQIPKAWTPHVAGKVNDALVKVAKFDGDFDWHSHEAEDEAFLVLRGKIAIDFRDGSVELGPNDFITIPAGVEHRPRALGDTALVALFEPETTLNTGTATTSDKTVSDLPSLYEL